MIKFRMMVNIILCQTLIITITIIIIIFRNLTPPIGIPALSGSTVKGQTAKSAITASQMMDIDDGYR